MVCASSAAIRRTGPGEISADLRRARKTTVHCLTLPRRGNSVPLENTAGRDQFMASFTITLLTDHTAAEVVALRCAQPVDAGVLSTLRRAFRDLHVLVMRDQH